MENYNYTCNTVLKFLRKVLNEINKSYIDSGMRTAFLMKRYIEKYRDDDDMGPQHVLLCMLKDIGLFYMDGEVPSDNPALAAASSYTFLEHCSPLGIAARPLLFYKAKFIETQSNLDYDLGLLMTLLNQVSLYIYQRYSLEDIEELLKTDKKRGLLKPEQVKRVIRLLKDQPDIVEKLNSESNLYVYETSRYISSQNYSDEVLAEYIDTTSFAFEFHNHETLAHTVTTAQIAYDLALKCRLTKETAEIIRIAGKVHDIGKIRVPREILCYPGRLEGDMLNEMQLHATYTREIIDGSFSYKIVEVASRHHEKLDGSGYPNHLTDKELSSADKVLAVADICSALYCKRSYKDAFDDEQIKDILLNDAKAGKLDKRIVEHLVDSFDEIMENAKREEAIVLQKYNNMKEEYEALSKSSALCHFFDYEDFEEDEDHSDAARETEEYMDSVAGVNQPEEEIIYVDEEGNEISSEEVEKTLGESEDDEFEKYINSLEEEIPTDSGEAMQPEISEDDEFEKYINSLEEEKKEKKVERKPITLQPNLSSFDPFAEPDEEEEEVEEETSVEDEEPETEEEFEEETSVEDEELEAEEESEAETPVEDEEPETEEEFEEETPVEDEELEAEEATEAETPVEDEEPEAEEEFEEETSVEDEEIEVEEESEAETPVEDEEPEAEEDSEEETSVEDEELEVEEETEVLEEAVEETPEEEEEFEYFVAKIEPNKSDDDEDSDEDDEDDDDEDDDEDDEDEEEEDDPLEKEEPVKKFFNNDNNKMKYMISSKKFKQKFKKR